MFGRPGVHDRFRRFGRSAEKPVVRLPREHRASPHKPVRKFPSRPRLLLEAPNFPDDFYLNLLDWSTDDRIAVGVDWRVYLYNVRSKEVELVRPLNPKSDPASVRFSADSSILAVGTDVGSVEFLDSATGSVVRKVGAVRSETFGGRNRTGVICWNGSILSAGSRCGTVRHLDPRCGRAKVGEWRPESGEICGLSWKSDERVCATGSNDDVLSFWDSRTPVPFFDTDVHRAAVKALAWCPWEPSLLVSAGGSNDCSVRFWDVSCPASLGLRESSVRETSPGVNAFFQTCAVVWSPFSRELATAHGFHSQGLSVWDFDSKTQLAELRCNVERVLQLSISPDGKTVCAAGGDMLQFWDLFPGDEKNQRSVLPTTSSNLSEALGRHLRSSRF